MHSSQTSSEVSRADGARMRRASSLIELLVVIALIALLFGMLMPSMKRSMILARATVCQHNLREIGNSLLMYRHENRGWLPANQSRPEGGVAGATNDEVWFLKLYPTYLPDPLALTCPEDPYGFRMNRARDELESLAPEEVADYASYGINSFIMNGGINSNRGKLANLDRFKPTRPHNTILIADLGPDTATPVPASQDTPEQQTVKGPVRNSSLLAVADAFDPFEGEGDSWLTSRHGYGINIGTITGGVRSARTNEAMRDTVKAYYRNCAVGGCTLCNDLKLYHYSFARDRLYWWTGPSPVRSSNQLGS